MTSARDKSLAALAPHRPRVSATSAVPMLEDAALQQFLASLAHTLDVLTKEHPNSPEDWAVLVGDLRLVYDRIVAIEERLDAAGL